MRLQARVLHQHLIPFTCSPVRAARVGAGSSYAELQLHSLLLPSESMRDQNEVEQVRSLVYSLFKPSLRLLCCFFV
jgi:hypothetical protein